MSSCDIEEVEGEIKDEELTIVRLIECKCRIEEVVNSNSSITNPVSDSASPTVAAAVNTSRLLKLILPKFREMSQGGQPFGTLISQLCMRERKYQRWINLIT